MRGNDPNKAYKVKERRFAHEMKDVSRGIGTHAMRVAVGILGTGYYGFHFDGGTGTLTVHAQRCAGFAASKQRVIILVKDRFLGIIWASAKLRPSFIIALH